MRTFCVRVWWGTQSRVQRMKKSRWGQRSNPWAARHWRRRTLLFRRLRVSILREERGLGALGGWWWYVLTLIDGSIWNHCRWRRWMVFITEKEWKICYVHVQANQTTGHKGRWKVDLSYLRRGCQSFHNHQPLHVPVELCLLQISSASSHP